MALPNVTYLDYPRLFYALVILLFVGTTEWSHGAEELDNVLRGWVGQNVHFLKDQEGKDTIFMRKQSVRADIRSEQDDVQTTARTAIANLANAFGLESQFTTATPNLVVVSVSGIAEGGKPNRPLLRSLGAPEVAINFLPESESWSTGCGAYAYWNKSGRLVYAIVAGDPNIAAGLGRCMVTGILTGFGLRSRPKDFINNSDDYVQYLLLARALAACDNDIEGSGQADESRRDRYIDCMVGRLKTRLTE
jgi:hypothetical protein